MKNMRRSERRAKTQKVIEKRKRIIKEIWQDPEYHIRYLQEGRLKKYNFTCDCAMCRWERRNERAHPKAKYMWYYENHDMDE